MKRSKDLICSKSGRLRRREFLSLASGAAAYAFSLGFPGSRAHAQGEEELHDVVVIGGGLSGLIAAYLMQEHDILLLEKEAVPGGRILSGTWEGFHYAMGAAYIGPPDEDKDMQEFFDELGIEPIPVPPPTDALAYKGVIYPEDYFDQVLGSSDELRDYARVSKELYELASDGIEEAAYNADIDRLAEYEELDRYSVKQWLEGKKVGPIVQRYIDVENRGLFGASNADFSLLFDIPEMAFNLYEGDLGDEDFIPRKIPDFHTYRPPVSAGDSGIWTFRKGMIEMVWAIQRSEGLRGKIRSGAQVNSVRINTDGTVSVSYIRNGKQRKVRAYAAVLATPAAVTASIVKSGFSATVMEALRAVPYTSYVTMALFLSERLFRNAWNIASLDTCFTTLNDAIRTQAPLDYKGKSILGVAMPPERANDRSLIRLSDKELLEKALKDIERYFPGVRSKVLGKDIYRFRHAFPVFRPHYGEILWELHKDNSTQGPLFLAGDFMVYPTLGGAAVSGWRAYEQVEHYAETL